MILVVTGLAAEARIARQPGIVTVCGGGDTRQLRALLAATDAKPIRAVISFGLAGGLDPALRAGNVVVAHGVAAGAQDWPTHTAVTSALMSRLAASRARPTLARIVGVDAVVLDPAAKAELHLSGGAAVDMESHVAGEFAARHCLPFGVVRVICDDARRELPPLARTALGAKGKVDLSGVIGSLVREPLQIPALLRTGRDFAVAMAALRRSRRLLGLGFGLADAGEFVLDVP